MKKKILVIGVILIIIAYAIFNIISYAGNALYIGIEAVHNTGYGYGIGDPYNGGGKQLWNLRNYNSGSKDDESATQKEIYCLKAEYGQAWENDTDAIVTYNLSYDLQEDRDKLLQLLIDSTTDTPNDVVTAILDNNSDVYKKLLWVLDNAFIPGKSNVSDVLEKIGIIYDAEGAAEGYSPYVYEPVDGYDYSDLINIGEYSYTLTETDVKAVQQAVIWYLMNAELDGDADFDNTEIADWLTITTDGENYTQLTDIRPEGAERFEQAQILYNYLIDSAEKNASNYKAGTNGYTISKPIEISTTGLTTNTDGKYVLEINKSGSNYIIGPIKINKNNELYYNLGLTLTDGNNKEIISSNYVFTDASGNTLEDVTIKDLVGRTDGFYIKVPKNVAQEFNIQISTSYTTNSKILWLSGTENGTTSITLKAEQPTVDISQETHSENITFYAESKEFDLALRKYITKLNGTELTNTRVPDISETTLTTGTTATYNHKKDPVVVKQGDTVTYAITIYNEGNRNGYATQIIDQLPTGLKYSGSTTLTSKDESGTNKNTYNVTYDEDTNRLIFETTTSSALNKYVANSLDRETITIECEVIQEPDTQDDKILTNVAWISKAYNSENLQEITNVGDDRDSEPQTSPNVTKDNMENYIGNADNKTDLTDSLYFYEGQQDDDDFEKLVVEPETEVTVNKQWVDNNNQDGLRPNSVSVSLQADGKTVEGKTVTLSDSNLWTHTFANLPVKSNGEIIDYSIVENTEVAGYTSNINEFIITNTHIPATTEVSVTKKWEDRNNIDGIRPSSIVINLLADGTKTSEITLSESNNWTHTFTDLPQKANGVDIAYTVEENEVPSGYTAEITGDSTTGYTITNTHKIFDLALRKYITKVNTTTVTNTRVPNISEDTLTTGTTATYKHKKDPVEVEENDIVTYAITIYNEGEKAGYASQIIDQLPTGLVYVPSSTVTSKDSTGVEKNTYTVTYESTTNKLTFDITGTAQELQSYKTDLDYETIEIQCKVVAEADESEDTILTNVAYISGAYDTEENKVATDIDSEPETQPNVNKDNMENYIGNTDNKNDLTDNTYYYEGEQDDDDFEKIVVKPQISISVTKVWEDSNNQDGTRPTSITVDLKNGNTTVDTVTLNQANSWTHTFTNLPKKENGTDINYTVQESGVPTGYKSETTGNMTTGYTITNTYTVQTTEVSVTKVWEDSNNQDGIRPTSITVELKNEDTTVDTVTLNQANSWKHTFTNLPKKANGTDINYTVQESGVSTGYTSETTGDMTAGYTITNTYTPATTEVSVIKVWKDNNNQDGIRPTSITVELRNGDTTVDTVTLNQANSWTHTFTNLPKKSNGTDIKYIVQESGVPTGYTSNTTGDMTTGYTITNTYTPETIEIPITKVWEDNNNQDGIRPTSITINLKNGDKVVDTVVLQESNNWKHTFTNLPLKEDGTEITYTLEETGIPTGYNSVITGDIETGFTITNTYSPEETIVKVTKVWDDNNDQDGIRPDSISVSLLANGEVVDGKTITLSEENNWTHTFEKLPVKENGEDITYSVQENTKIDGYTSSITNKNVTSSSGQEVQALANDYEIINSHETDETSVTVNKQWVDDNNSDGIRPTSVIIALLANNVEQEQVTLDTSNNWTHTFENLPSKEDGQDIVYTVQEKEVPTGYTVEITGDVTTGFTITNTHIPEKIFDLSLRKYITAINNNKLDTLGIEQRVPNISKETLINGTTATYKHKKEPISVEENDIITYSITIYNEGEKAGYASQIIDQLPTGLIYNPSSTITSVDAIGAERNTYIATYESSTNKITFNIVNTKENPAQELQPYESELDYETLEIKCKVIYESKAGEKNILTNVAWISGAYDTEENEVAVDRDSQPETKPNVNKDNMEDYKGNTSNKDDLTDKDYFYKGEQDDDDFEKIYVKTFDLSLRKFVNQVNTNKLQREPVVDVSPLVNKTNTTAIYNHSKKPVALKVGDTVIYTIRIYNEGEIDGFANEVKDYLPPYLEYVENSTINNKYGWQISEDGRIVTTAYLSNYEISAFNGTTLDYEDLQIECKLSEQAIPNQNLTNIAEISEYKYGDTVVTEDIDSESNNIDENLPEDNDLPNYKKDEENNEYIPGNEDDDDFEKVYVKEFDLALRKFITQIQDEEITTRIPQAKLENGQIKYEHSKDAITLHVDDVVIYTIRIYNEGEINGYASEITDDIPEYLEYLPKNSTNTEYMWKMYDENGNETEDTEKAVKVKTEYLSKEQSENNLIKAFDGNTLYYKDIKIAFKVKDPNSNEYIITNHAQISEDTDEDGKSIKDKDSETNKWNEREDDQDIENVKVEYFDLSLLKFVSKVIVSENGTEKITETGYNGLEEPEPVVKVELHKKKLQNVVVKFGYGITITNEGDVPGYATEITDYIPEGLKFESADNPNWTNEGNNVISTKQLEGKLLQPGESATIEVILTWINGADNLNLKTNTAEISEDKNEYDVPDRDSTPDNKQEGEDDVDIAKVILTIATGAVKTYFTLTLGLLIIIALGIFAIKKFVL